MSWSTPQRERLAYEKKLLDEYFPDHVKWHNPATFDAYVEIEMISNSDKQFTFRVYLPKDYPNSCPEMVLVSPSDLRLKNGDELPRNDAKFHTCGERDTFTKICHSLPELWTNGNTIYQLFMKGRLWIAAYEGHMDTEKDIDVFLNHKQTLSSSEDNLFSGNVMDEEKKITRSCVIQ